MELTFNVEPRYLSSITFEGLKQSTQAIFEGQKVLITDIHAGQGMAADPFNAQSVASPIPGSWVFITSDNWHDIEEADENNNIITHKARVIDGRVANTRPGNITTFVTQPAHVRELIFMAVKAPESMSLEEVPSSFVRFPYAYAWLPEDEPDINNVLVPPEVPGMAPQLLPFRMPIYLTNAENAQLRIAFELAGLMTRSGVMQLLEEHTQKTPATEPNGVHGLRIRNRRLQVYLPPYGWSNIGRDGIITPPVGYIVEYFNAQKFTATAFNARNYTVDKFNNIIRTEAVT